MAYEQVKSFNIKKMGTRAGWCLMNCRLGFGINKGTFASAKADMESQKKNGTLHPLSTLPKNVAVPIYIDTSSPYEHVIVSDKGTYYSDGKILTSLNGLKTFGWGELCDGVRVVKPVSTPKPTPTTFKVGDKVTLNKWVDYNGKSLVKTRDYYTISEIKGDRAVLKSGNVVYSAVKTSNLKKYTAPANNAPKIGNKVKTSATRDIFGNNLNLRIINDGQSVWKKTTDKNRAWLYKGGVLRCVVPVSSLKKV